MDNILPRLKRRDFREGLVDAVKRLVYVKETVKDIPPEHIPFNRLREISHYENLIKEYRVELERRRSMDQPAHVFYSYSRYDLEWMKELDESLSELKSCGPVKIFWDIEMDAGREWHPETTEKLFDSDIILVLVSPDLLTSRYCNQIEIPKAMELHDSGLAQVIPVIIRECNWQGTELGRLQAVPRGGVSIVSRPDRSSAWAEVASAIEAAVHKARGVI